MDPHHCLPSFITYYSYYTPNYKQSSPVDPHQTVQPMMLEAVASKALEMVEDVDQELHYIQPRSHTHTIIFLHGRDSHAAEFASELFESEASGTGPRRTLLDLFPTVRWVFPNAPRLRSARFGAEMRQWFDMWSVEKPAERPELQEPGIRQSVRRVGTLVRKESCRVPRANIFLGGISQGFATALATCLSDKSRGGEGGLAGLVGLCSWMPEVCRDWSMEPHAMGDTPVLLGHSVDDDVVPVEHGRELRDKLLARKFSVEWREYANGGHWVNEPQGVDDIVRFLKAHMAAPTR